MIDPARLEEFRKKVRGVEGLAASVVRAAIEEIAGGNIEFGRGLQEAIADLEDADASLKAMAKELEELSN